MTTPDIKYYFSTKALTFTTLFIVGITTLVLLVFFKLYKVNLIWAIVFLSPLIVILIMLPDYFRFLYCAVIRRPALELTKDFLINNAKGDAYKWTDIKEIVYKRFTGFKHPPGGYIEVAFIDSEEKISIPNNSIKCKTKDLLEDLQAYLKSSKMKDKL